MHKHLHGYMRVTCQKLGAAVREMKRLEAHLPVPVPVPVPVLQPTSTVVGR
jgi:aminoglycoside phosphotransferase (APT) family kinase protein